ncbi:MAG: 5-methyltetrahydropteroyltriglutamate--homocysteine S-methyltransferase [bacterium]
MVLATNLGFPRIGPRRELKRAVEGYWSGRLLESELLETGASLRKENWTFQKRLGFHHIPSNDFSFYDHVLDTIAMVGAVPRRFAWQGETVDLQTYFAMARGQGVEDAGSGGVPAMAMKKWFDTNYHYIVPEFESGQTFRLAWTKPIDEFLEAKGLGVQTRPVLLGPVSFLLLGRSKEGNPPPLSLLDALLPVYEQILDRLAQAGAEWIQMDEPCLVLDLEREAQAAFKTAYDRLSGVSQDLRILLATYFGDLRDNLPVALNLPVAGIHLDLVRAPSQLDAVLKAIQAPMSLSLGLVNGRNIWRTDLDQALQVVTRVVKVLGSERVLLAPSCSLLHSPVDVDLETRLDKDLQSWLAFAKQKLEEIALLARAVADGPKAAKTLLAANREAMRSRRTSTRVHNEAVKTRTAAITQDMLTRHSPYTERKPIQQKRLQLPLLPTTTIGSFPQTKEVRAARANNKSGKMGQQEYEAFLRTEIENTVRFQDEIGIDVIVHGEFERNDMVEYFGEQLSGFVSTQNGWVQSYGSRCVKPPIIYGDLQRLNPMTVSWWKFAQSLTSKPVKGMLTGPVTILQWSFVRDDQPRSETCRQIALAIRDEVADLETAGARIIQIDEPAIREGLPLRREDWHAYLSWAVDAFRIASSGVKNETQIHTHMCYSEFNDIIEAIVSMDADVLSIETSRSQLDLLETFARYHYPNEIGPGVYDIHSPRIPSHDEVESLLRRILTVLSPTQVWVNPDCGLKTRRWEEVKPALKTMVEAAKSMRAQR